MTAHITNKMCTKNCFHFVVDKCLFDFLSAAQYMLPNIDLLSGIFAILLSINIYMTQFVDQGR